MLSAPSSTRILAEFYTKKDPFPDDSFISHRAVYALNKWSLATYFWLFYVPILVLPILGAHPFFQKALYPRNDDDLCIATKTSSRWRFRHLRSKPANRIREN